MIHVDYDYGTVVQHSEKVAWTVDDVFPAETRLDFTRHFLPDALTGANAVARLSPRDRLLLDHIRGNSYVHLFYFVEEYIGATALKHAQAELFGEHLAVRALLRFADEELKHQQLFERVKAAFAAQFPVKPRLLESADEVAGFILRRSPIAVLLLTLEFELVTQQHFTEHVQHGDALEVHFRSILRHHWMEEAQHAKVDTLELAKLVEGADAHVLETAFDDLLELVVQFGALLDRQAELDVATLEDARGERLEPTVRDEVMRVQRTTLRDTFLGMGLTHPVFVTRLEQIWPDGAQRAVSLQHAARRA